MKKQEAMGVDTQRCRHCGEEFTIQGIKKHETNCPLGDIPTVRFDEDREAIVRRDCLECGAVVGWDDDDLDHEDSCTEGDVVVRERVSGGWRASPAAD